MIVNRRTFIAKQKKVSDVVELLKNPGEGVDFSGTFRIYISEFGTFDRVAFEMEFEDWEQYHKFWAEAHPDEAWWEQWFASTESGGTNEMWYLA